MKTLWILPVILLLSACTDTTLPPLPEGEQTVSGVVNLAEISLVRRGTHTLSKNGELLFFLESSSVSFSSLEGKQATLTGILEHNTDPKEKPVMVVSEIIDFEDATRSYRAAGFGMDLTVSEEWHELASDGLLQFFETGALVPLVSIEWGFLEELPDDDNSVQILVDGQRALRSIDPETGGETLFIVRGERVLTVRFIPPIGESLTLRKAEWVQFLKSIVLDRLASPPPSLSGTGSSIPCGGPAGVLCPEGYFCDVTDLVENIGKCREI